MDPTTIVIVFAFAWGAVVLYRIHRRRQQVGGAESRPAPARPAQEGRQMPRLGQPGTITFNQIQALRRNSFTPDRNWSREEAALILDAVKYLRAVCRDVAGDADGPPPLEVQNELLRVVLTTQDVREHVRKWGEARRETGHAEFDDDEPALPRNDQYETVAARARAFLKA